MPKTYAIPNLMFPRFVPGESWHLQQGYMIPIRLPWRLRARPSATLHEIQGLPRRANPVSMLQTDALVRQEVC